MNTFLLSDIFDEIYNLLKSYQEPFLEIINYKILDWFSESMSY